MVKQLLLFLAGLGLAVFAIWHPAPHPAGFAVISTTTGVARPLPAPSLLEPAVAVQQPRHQHGKRKKHRFRRAHHRHSRHSRKRKVLQVAAGSIDLNHASEATLAHVPGIGPAIAGRIVAFRAASGAFSNADELLDVMGMTGAHLARARPYLLIR